MSVMPVNDSENMNFIWLSEQSVIQLFTCERAFQRAVWSNMHQLQQQRLPFRSSDSNVDKNRDAAYRGGFTATVASSFSFVMCTDYDDDEDDDESDDNENDSTMCAS